jgi:hypothetical protein
LPEAFHRTGHSPTINRRPVDNRIGGQAAAGL